MTQQNIFDVEKIRNDFPVLQQQAHGKPLVYLDNAATSQKPSIVIEAVDHYYREYNSNIHRGVHALSQLATQAYEDARQKVQRFINANSIKEIIFVRGATEAINLVAQTFGRSQIKSGDEILISEMEHHSNIVPWQLLCEQNGCHLKVIPITDHGELDIDAFEKLLTPKVKLLAITHISNALGTINPIAEMIQAAKTLHIPTLVDGCQAAPHCPIDVQALDCDFYVVSGHKMYAPTGIGFLYGKAEHLRKMPPYQGGGEMIQQVSFDKTTYNDIPCKFEAGTPNIAGAIGLGAAIDYIQKIGLDQIQQHEDALLSYATELAQANNNIRIIGEAQHKAGILSFLLNHAHAHDVGTIVDMQGVAIRAGHHCSMPVMERYGIAATSRASFAIYNTHEEVDALFAALRQVEEVFT